MEKVTTFAKFAVKVFLALAAVNLVLGLLPEGIGDRIRAFSIDPLGAIRG